MTGPRSDVAGTVYLIHLDRPLAHAQHYIGWTEEPLDERLARHGRSNGSRFLAAAKATGITWRLARTWPNVTRRFERRLKRAGHGGYFCPICQGPIRASVRGRAEPSERALDTPRACRVCGCTDDDCTACVERTGSPCYWVESDLCSACVPGPLN